MSKLPSANETDASHDTFVSPDAASGGENESGRSLEPSRDAAADRPAANIDSLIDQHHAHVYRYAYRLTGSEADAEDLTQQAFLITQQKIEQLRDPQRARSWIYAILRSCFLKGLRKRSPKLASDLEMTVDEIPSETAEHLRFDSQSLQEALNQLPPEFRIVVAMFYYEQYSYQEIADKLDLKIGTVMSRLSRAKGRLRHRLMASESLSKNST